MLIKDNIFGDEHFISRRETFCTLCEMENG